MKWTTGVIKIIITEPYSNVETIDSSFNNQKDNITVVSFDESKKFVNKQRDLQNNNLLTDNKS